jgi:hypothetical protein
VDNLPAGQHSVQLSGVASNCSVQGPNPQTVTVPAGGSEDVNFSIVCSTPVGSVHVKVTTTPGGQPDENGYVVTLDPPGTGKDVAANDEVTFADVNVGSYNVVLKDVASNCTVAEGKTQPIRVTADVTTEVTFSVDCPAPPQTGSIHITTRTSGDNQDGDGYDVVVDGGTSQHMQSTDAITVNGVDPGDHTVELSGLASNCTVDGEHRDVTVTAGETANVDFNINCSAPSVNNPPVAENDFYSTTIGTPLHAPGEKSPGLLSNDIDPDDDVLSTREEEKPTTQQGNVVIGNDGSFDYTPPSETFTGSDKFDYTVMDGRGGESTAIATIEVATQ